MSTTDDLRAVLEQHAVAVEDRTASERVGQVRSRVRTARRRRRGGGGVLAALLVAVAAVGVTTYVDRADRAPAPIDRDRDDRVLLTEGGSGLGVNEVTDHIEVPSTALELEYWCTTDQGWMTVDINGHPLVDATPCSTEKAVVKTEGGGIELGDGTTIAPGDMAEIRMRLYERRGDTRISQASDTQMKLRVWKVADPRVPRIGDVELSDTYQTGSGDVWQLVEVRASEPGAREFATQVEPGTMVAGVIGYRAEGEMAPFGRTGSTSFGGPSEVALSRVADDGELVPETAGGRVVLRLTEDPDADGLIGFALYRKIG